MCRLRHVASRAKAKIEAQQKRNRTLYELLKRADPRLALTVDGAAESALSGMPLQSAVMAFMLHFKTYSSSLWVF